MSTLEIQTAKVFEPLLAPARYKGAHGGRGSGKSRFWAGYAVEQCVILPGFRLVCIREVQKSLRDSVKLLLEDEIRRNGLEGMFDIKSDHIRTPGGGQIVFQGMADHTAESVKSLEGFHAAYGEEAQTLTQRSLELLRPTIRTPHPNQPPTKSGFQKSELWFSWNPRNRADPVDLLLRGPARPDDSIVVAANYMDNPWFPADLEEDRKEDELYNPVRYPHIWLGHYEPMAVGAIWSRDVIARNRLASQRDIPISLKRIVVAVDPPTTSGENADECGLVVAGIGEDNRGYVLADESFAKATPEMWAARAVALYDSFDADAIVAEVNNGGEMVVSTIHAVRSSVKVIQVRATRGKHVRAEPVAALYARDLVSHVGAFPTLEGQMCQFTVEGYEGQGSPDHVDALVWAFTELFPNIIKKTEKRNENLPTKANNGYNPHRMMK